MKLGFAMQTLEESAIPAHVLPTASIRVRQGSWNTMLRSKRGRFHRPAAFIYLPRVLISSIVQDKIKLCPNLLVLHKEKGRTYKNRCLASFFA